METPDYWNGLISKGASRFLLLAALAERPRHGYELAQAIAAGCGDCCSPTDAMIYPAIRELSEAGLIACRDEVEGGRRRRVCTLTPAGREAFRVASESWSLALPALRRAVKAGLAEPAAKGKPS
jgi:DNA-binding PadR family transcriptional regulator